MLKAWAYRNNCMFKPYSAILNFSSLSNHETMYYGFNLKIKNGYLKKYDFTRHFILVD